MINFIPVIFLLGYLLIVFEHSIKINKAASALLTGILCWTAYTLGQPDVHLVNEKLLEHVGDIAGILFFLLGAMTIVELIDSHDGFSIITQKIKTKNKRSLLWTISLLAFFLSAVLDNLTTTIVMVALIRKLLSDKNEKLLFIGMIIIAANAGGAWSPIGDVTTTMLWIGGRISSTKLIIETFLPSLICLIVPVLLVQLKMKGTFERPEVIESETKDISNKERSTILFIGIGCLIFVPFFKAITHLPPYMGILLGLSLMWIVTEYIHKGKEEEDRNQFSVHHALKKVDTSSILFFLGILLAVAVLQSTGFLSSFAQSLDKTIGSPNAIVILIGLLSAIIDNVPIVAAAMGMYSLEHFPIDSHFWLFLAYCAGTGGSSLIIGSAAGVAAMGMEKISFFWYLKKISLLATLGYLAGAAWFILESYLF